MAKCWQRDIKHGAGRCIGNEGRIFSVVADEKLFEDTVGPGAAHIGRDWIADAALPGAGNGTISSRWRRPAM